VGTGVSPNASQDAAAAQAAHEVLVSLYPTLQTTLDTQLRVGRAQRIPLSNTPHQCSALNVRRLSTLFLRAFRQTVEVNLLPSEIALLVSWFLRAGSPTSAVAAFNLKLSLSPRALEWGVRLLPILPKLLLQSELQGRVPVGHRAEPKTRP
jgi:hypothetical protein